MKRFLLTLLVAFIAHAGWSQCAATFSYDTTYGNSNQLMLHSTYISGGASVFYDWYIPGGTPSSSNNYTTAYDSVLVTYNTPGYHTVCLTIYDSINNCTDSICDSVSVPVGASPLTVVLNAGDELCGQCNGFVQGSVTQGGTPPFSYNWSNGGTTLPLLGLCAGTYTLTVTDNNGVTVTDSVTVGNNNTNISPFITANGAPCPGSNVQLTAISNFSGVLNYSWNTGANTQSINVNQSGTYEVTVSDTMGCSDIASMTLNYNTPILLSGSVTQESGAGNCDGSATVNASGGSFGYTYSWSNGGSGSTISNLCAGTYSVTVTDSLGCTADTAMTVTTAPGCAGSVEGNISPVTESTVYLIEENGGVLSLVDSIDIDSGYYMFSNVCPGTYFVKAALRPISSQYTNFLPTYYLQSALWGGANSIVINGANVDSIDITLLAGLNTGGPGFIGGLISQGANRAEGDPIVGAEVFLLNANNEVIASETSDENGDYSFDGLELGSYQVYVDLLNYTPYPHSVTLTSEMMSTDSKNFITEGNTIKPVDPTGLNDIAGENSVNVYPNPATDRLTITGEAINSVKIYNIVGQQVVLHTSNGENLIELSVEDLNSGQYIISVETENGITHQNLIKH